MPSTVALDEPLIRANISRAVTDVFRIMLARPPTLCVPADRAAPAPASRAASRPQIVGSVGFVGEINGLVYLHFDLGFAHICVGHLLGMNAAELTEAGDEVVNDAIGELTNMTVGSFKNGLCDAGFPCLLTIPSILRGDRFSIATVSSAVRHVFHFDCAEHCVVADILIKSDN